jgi:hypothetical protein
LHLLSNEAKLLNGTLVRISPAEGDGIKPLD